ncbi:hypothetical protein ACLOJK_014615, partial [Asimina triloba]
MIRSPEEQCEQEEVVYTASEILMGVIRSAEHNQDPIRHGLEDPEGHSVIVIKCIRYPEIRSTDPKIKSPIHLESGGLKLGQER